MGLAPTGISTATATVAAPRNTAPPQDAKLYAAGLIAENGGTARPNYGRIVGQIEALLQNSDPAVKEFGRAVEREVVGQLSGGNARRAVEAQRGLDTATYTAGTESFSRTGMTIEARRTAAAAAPNIKNPDYVEYMKYDRAFGDGKWSTDDSAKIGDAWRSMIAAGASTPADYNRIARAADQALGTTIANFQSQFSGASLQSMVGDGLLRGLTQSERLSGTDMAQDIGLLLRKGPEIHVAFQVGMVKGAAGAAWEMVSSVAVLAGKAVQYGGDTVGGGIIGKIGDAARSATPDWVKDGLRAVGADGVLNASVPSYTRGVESNRALGQMGTNVRNYFATHTAEQMGQDALNALDKKWDSIKGEFYALNGDPVKQAEWLGEKAGAVLFEVASTVVPVTKLGTAAKVADKIGDAANALDTAADVAKVAGKLDDVADVGKIGKAGADVAESLLRRAKRILGDMPLNSASLDTLYQAGKLTMDEARALAKDVGWKEPNGWWIYPPNEGFANAPKVTTLAKGDQILIDRYGKPTGNYASPLGESYGGRALPPGTAKTAEYHVYKITGDIDALIGRATPWFDEPGGAIQYKLDSKIEKLLDQEKLLEIKR